LGYVGAAATKSMIIGLIILATSTFFVPLRILHPLGMITFLLLTSVSFSLFGFMLGIWAVCIGALFLIVAAMNRAAPSETQAIAGTQAQAAAGNRTTQFRNLQWLMLYLSGLMLVLSMFFRMEYTWDVYLHSASAYIAVAIGTPLYFAAIHVCSRNRWAASSVMLSAASRAISGSITLRASTSSWMVAPLSLR